MPSKDNSQPPKMDAKTQAALSHPKRSEIFGFIREKDGTSEGELADEFGMGICLVAYHLKVLHDADLIAPLGDEQEPGGVGRSYVAATSL
jgi:DNA-binding transcriptional ArsR family regulator